MRPRSLQRPGRVSASGACNCEFGYSGTACDECKAGFTGYPDCVADLCYGFKCNGHGDCLQEDGSCDCNEGYAGDECGECDVGYIGYPECVLE